MTITIRQVGPTLGGEVSGLDMRKPLTADEVAAIHAGMDKYAVLVFRDQDIDDAQQLAFTQSLGKIEHAIGTSLRAASETRLPTTFADVSNLDKDNKPYARDDRRRLFAIGNRLWHSDSSFKVTPAKYSLLHALSIPSKGGDTQFADMRAAYDALDDETKAQVENMVCEHSQMYSRQIIGFTDFTEEERERFRPVRQCMVRTHPVDRPQVALSLEPRRRDRRLADTGSPRLPARPDRARDAARIRLHAQMAAGRSRDVGQSPDHAPRPPLPRPRAARHASHDTDGRWTDGRAGPGRSARRLAQIGSRTTTGISRGVFLA